MNLKQIEVRLAASHDDPLAMQYWSGYKTALMDMAVPDRVIEAVCADLKYRSEIGIKKYGVTLEDRKDLTLDQWLEHAYTEALDMANYLKRAIIEIRGEL